MEEQGQPGDERSSLMDRGKGAVRKVTKPLTDASDLITGRGLEQSVAEYSETFTQVVLGIHEGCNGSISSRFRVGNRFQRQDGPNPAFETSLSPWIFGYCYLTDRTWSCPMVSSLEDISHKYKEQYGDGVRSQDRLRDIYESYVRRRESTLLDSAAATAAIHALFFADEIDFGAITPQMSESFDRAYPANLVQHLDFGSAIGGG